MGNGSQMKPIDELQRLKEEGGGEDLTGEGGGGGGGGGGVGGGLLDGYRFGDMNDQELRCRKLRSWDIVAR